MADRTVSVRLTSNVQQFMRNMSAASASTARLTDELEDLDRKRIEPEIVLDVDEARVRRAVAGIADVAEDEGERRSGGFFGALFTPNPAALQALRTGIPAALSSPIGLAGVALGGVFAASFVSAVVSAGALAGIGAGFTGLAAVVLKENARLKESFADLAESARIDLVQAAGPLVPTFDRALSQIETMFEPHIADPLERIFTGLGPSVVPAVESAVRTVGEVLDSLATPEFLTGMRTVLDEISEQMPRLGQAVGDAFVTLASNADDIAEAFGNVVTITSGLISFATSAINAFTDLFNTISSGAGRVIGFIRQADQAAKDSNLFLPGEQTDSGAGRGQSMFEQLKKSHSGKGLFEATGDVLRDLGVPEFLLFTERATGATEVFAAEVAGLNNRAEEAAREGLAQMAERQEQLTDAIDGTNDRLSLEEDKLQQLKDSMFAAAEGVLGLRDSTRTYEESLDSATETIERNGATLDVNTEAGRQNQAAIDEIAASALGHIQIMIEQGESTKKVSKFTQQARDDFIAAADAAGLEKDEAKRLADQLGLVPSEVETKIKAIDQMSDTINSLKRQIRELQRLAGIVPINASIGSFFGSAHVIPNRHSGGMIGAELPRAHSGMRLAPDERVIIGQTGERVLSRQQNAAFEAQGGLAGLGHGGVTVQNLNVQAWTGRFSLRQIEDELAFHGAA